MTRVLAIDAGESTGLAVVEFTPSGPIRLFLDQFIADTTQTMRNIAREYRTFVPDVVIAEQFDLRPSNKFTADLSTVYRNGALEYMFEYEFEDEVFWQTPGQAKGLVSDTVLKRFGSDFWPTGKTVGYKDANDARDALRHALRYGVEVLEHLPTTKKGWPQS